MKMRMTRWCEWLRCGMLIGVMTWTLSGVAQEAARRAEATSPRALKSDDSVSDSVRELRDQVRELQEAVAGMRSDWQRARAETAELHRELDEVRAGTGPREAVLRNAVAKSESKTSASAAENLQNGSPEFEEQREDQ